MFAFILCVASSHVPKQLPQKKKKKLLRNTKLTTHCSGVASFKCCFVYNKTQIIHGRTCMLSMLHGLSYGTVDKRSYTYSACEYICSASLSRCWFRCVKAHVSFSVSFRSNHNTDEIQNNHWRARWTTNNGQMCSLISCRSFYSKINAMKLRHFAMPWICVRSW